MESPKSSIRSLISLTLIITSLFSVAFLQMEERRQSYAVLKLNRELKKNIEQRRGLEVKLLNALRPQKIEREVQSRTVLNQAESKQIIHLPTGHIGIDSNSMEPNL